jgi:hypothetical protein
MTDREELIDELLAQLDLDPDNASEDAGIKNIDHIEPEVDTELSDDLDLDLGLDEDLAAKIRETDGVDPAESPLLSERIAVLHLLGQLIVALLQGKEIDRDDLVDHLRTIEDLERSALLKEVELVGDESDGD